MAESKLDDDALRALAKLIVTAETAPPEAAEAAVRKGLVNFGRTFVQSAAAAGKDAGPRGERMMELIHSVTKSWLNGDRISDKADEDERRARFALEMMKLNPILTRLAANALFRLPEGHPLRDVQAIRESLLKMLDSATGTVYPDLGDSPAPDQTGSALLAAAGLIQHGLLPPGETLALIDAGEKWANENPAPGDWRREFRMLAAFDLATRAIHARDLGDEESRRRCVSRAKEIFAPVVQHEPAAAELSRQNLLVVRAIEEVENGNSGTGAGFGALSELVRSAGKPDEISLLAARYSARSIYEAGRYVEVIRLLAPVVPVLAEHHLMAVSGDRIRASGSDFAEASTILAFAYAQLGRWGSALSVLDRAKSPRTRYLAALRSTDAGRRAIQLESALGDFDRGVTGTEPQLEDPPAGDPVSSQLTVGSRLLEAYGSVRRSFRGERLSSPGIWRIARSLNRGEAVLILGVANFGILLAVLRRGDYWKPSFTALLPEQDSRRLLETLLDDEGWIMVSQTPGIVADPRPALSNWLQTVDAIIGAAVARLLHRSRVRRLIVVPHGIMHLTPFWLLPSLAHLEVVVAPTAAHAVSVNSRPMPARSKAVVIADPTLDLGLTRAEASCVASRLKAVGLAVSRIEGRESGVAGVTQAARGASVLHFSGHGRSDILRPLSSGLELHADPACLGLEGPDPLSDLARAAAWSPFDSGYRRTAPIPGRGTLSEQFFPADKRCERRLEHPGGTLLGTYRWRVVDARSLENPETELIRLAGLWTAGSILKTDAFAQCRLVFLSSCDAALGGLGHPVDEFAGLPAALQVAGVGAVVAPMWPVGAGLAALFADLFYTLLAGQKDESDLPGLVASIRTRLRTMKRDEASQRLVAMGLDAGRPTIALMLEAAAQQVADGPEVPFEHPYDCGAFHVLGPARLRFG